MNLHPVCFLFFCFLVEVCLTFIKEPGLGCGTQLSSAYCSSSLCVTVWRKLRAARPLDEHWASL